jgi:hypothetical protein
MAARSDIERTRCDAARRIARTAPPYAMPVRGRREAD